MSYFFGVSRRKKWLVVFDFSTSDALTGLSHGLEPVLFPPKTRILHIENNSIYWGCYVEENIGV